jgi:hypothetical protein
MNTSGSETNSSNTPIPSGDTEIERWNSALMIAIEDLVTPRPETRATVRSEHCWVEFFAIREELLRHAHSLLKTP